MEDLVKRRGGEERDFQRAEVDYSLVITDAEVMKLIQKKRCVNASEEAEIST